jgi:hypothetical protein
LNVFTGTVFIRDTLLSPPGLRLRTDTGLLFQYTQY